MHQAITRTKIVTPRRRPDMLTRQRLLDLLYDLLDYKLVLAIAPAGYGKTALLIDFAHQVEMPVCWYVVDELDRDLQRFFAYFSESLIHNLPQISEESAGRLRALASSPRDPDELVTFLVNELYEHVHEHFLFVVDDYHWVDDDPEIGRFVSQFVQLVDENCHVVLSSRKLLTLPDLPLMVARSYVGGLSFEELRFHEDEIQQLIQQNYDLSMPETEVRQLAQSTEGWITGLLLSSPQLGQSIADQARLARASGVGLYDYLAQQILSQQPPAIRKFLLYTSLLGEFNASLCETVLEPEMHPADTDWQALIDDVVHNNLFVLNVGEDGSWLRYHQLFQEFLQQTIGRECPAVARSIRERLAAFYRREEEWEKAYSVYQTLQDSAAIAELLEEAGSALLKRGRVPLLGSWLDDLPPDFFAKRPSLVSLKGFVELERGNAQTGLNFLNEAITREDAKHRGTLARTFVRRAMAHHHLGNYVESTADAERSMDLVAEMAPPNDVCNSSEPVAIEAEARRISGLNAYMAGHYTRAIEQLLRSLEKYRSINDVHNSARVTLEIATAHMGAGYYGEALSYFETVLGAWRELHNVTGEANALNNMGVLYHLQGDYEKALDFLVEALACSRNSGYVRMQAFTLASIGDLFADLRMGDIAESIYGQAYTIAQDIDERFLLLHLNLARTLLSWSSNGQRSPQAFLDAARQLVAGAGSEFEQGIYRMAVGQFHILGGRKDEAIAPLKEAVACLANTDQRVEEARAHLFLAAACHDAGEHSNAIDSVTQTFEIASKLEHWHPLVTAGYTVSDFLETVQGNRDCGANVTRLLQQVREFDRTTPALRRRLRQKVVFLLPHFSTYRPRLYIRTLGRGEVTLDNQVIESSDWQTQAARELFLCFVAHPDGLSKEEVGEIFWPGASPGQLKVRFKNAIYRLRSALFQEVVVFEDNIYRFDRSIDYGYDVELFEDAIAAAESTAHPEEKLAALQKVTELYQGDYLPEMDAMWVQLERERLWRMYTKAMLDLAQLYLDKGELSATLTCCQKLLAIDPCLESAHRMAMRVHAARGNRADVARQYEQCQAALLNELGVPPSPETETLYDQLMS